MIDETPAGWLFSTEPDDYPWQTLFSEKKVTWDGIRGNPARKWLRQVRAGDLVVGYHAAPEKQLVCLARAAGAPRPDPADEEWLVIDLEPVKWLAEPVPLKTLKTDAVLSRMPFSRLPRLSVSPLFPDQWERMLSLAKTTL